MTDTCRAGHPRTEANTRLRFRDRPGRKPTVTRVCRPCEAAAQRRSSWWGLHAAYVDLLTDIRLGGMSLAERRERTGL